MEFIDGITVCSDCKGPLVASKEIAIAMKKKEKEEAMMRERAMMEELRKNGLFGGGSGEEDEFEEDFEDGEGFGEGLEDGLDGYQESEDGQEGGGGKGELSSAARTRQKKKTSEPPVGVYVDKAQKYEDLKSSASAFLIIGGLLLVFSILCWAKVINLPMYGISKLIFQGALTAMGIFSLAVFLSTSKSAKQLAPEIDQEKHQTEELIAWFLDNYSAQSIDSQIPDQEELSEEERSLKRFQIIQDYFITGKDLPDPAYVDALCEEVYGKLYES